MPDESLSPDRAISIEGIRVPRFLYGTAWKEDATERLTELAIARGFRGINTANQRRHYHEAAVGQAIAASIKGGLVTRDDLFLQSKFTFRRGQDHRLPYDPDAPIATQVEKSLASSLEHLGIETLDSYVLHGPSGNVGLAAPDWAAWRAMEAIHDSGRARMLGISNVTLEQLRQLCQEARVRPRFVQNRCYAATAWDRDVRQFCDAHEIVYQGFSLPTANRKAIASSDLGRIAERHQRSRSQAIFRFAFDVGMMALTGTTSAEHMQEDLSVFEFRLAPEELQQIENLAVAGGPAA